MNSAIKKEEEKNYNNLKKMQIYQHLKKILSSILLFQVSIKLQFPKKLNHSSNFRVIWNTFAVKIRETQCSTKRVKNCNFKFGCIMTAFHAYFLRILKHYDDITQIEFNILRRRKHIKSYYQTHCQ